MTRRLSSIIAFLCLVGLFGLPLFILWLLLNQTLLIEIAQRNLPYRIIWESVQGWQISLLWLFLLLYVCIGLLGLFYLRRAFLSFAKGNLFDLTTIRDLRRFTILIFVQALSKPIYYALLSVVLSWNHPAGQKMLAVNFGSNEVSAVGLGLVFWVICNLFLEAEKLKKENQQFI